MRFILFVFLILNFAYQSYSQNIAKSDTILTKDLITNSDIKAKVYNFENWIYKLYIDSTSNTSTFVLRELSKDKKEYKSEGNISVLDLDKEEILWDKKISKNNDFDNFYQLDSLLVYSDNDKFELLNIQNGNQLWHTDRYLYYIIPKKKIALTYPATNKTSKLEAFDLTSGYSLWKREFNNEKGWEDIKSVNDSIYLIYANGFHTLNINNGKGIDIYAKTEKENYTGVVVTSAASLALGLLTGYFYIPTNGPSVVDNIRSNALIDSSAIYFASRKNLSKISNDKITLWKVDLPNKHTSYSNLFIRDSILYMVNYGYANKYGKKIAYGKPFFNAYNSYTGNLIYSVKLEGKSVLEYKIKQDRIIFLSSDGISQYSLADGSFISNRKFDPERYGNISSFVDNKVYYNNNSIYQPLIKEDKNNYCIYFSNGNAHLLNSRFETIDEKTYNEQYFLNSKYNEFEILTQDTLTILINKEGKPILNLPNFYNATISEGKLYGKNGNKFLEIDLNQIRKRENE